MKQESNIQKLTNEIGVLTRNLRSSEEDRGSREKKISIKHKYKHMQDNFKKLIYPRSDTETENLGKNYAILQR